MTFTLKVDGNISIIDVILCNITMCTGGGA